MQQSHVGVHLQGDSTTRGTRKVLVLTRATTHHPGFGGMEAINKALMEGLVEKGLEIECLTTHCPDHGAVLIESGVTYRFLQDAPCGQYSSAWFRRSVEWIGSRPIIELPHLILSQSGAARGYVHHLRLKMGIPAIAIIHGITPWSLKASLLQAHSPRRWLTSFKLLLRCFYERFLEPGSHRRYDRMVALGPRMAVDLARHLQVEPGRIEVIPNFVDLQVFRPGTGNSGDFLGKLGMVPSQFLVLMASRLLPSKGTCDAIRAVARLPRELGVHLAIAGEGPHASEVRALVRKLHLEDRVHLLGQLPREELAVAYSAADLFAFPSFFPEGLPMAILEALSSGLPVVSTLVGEISLAVLDGENGFHIPVQDPEALAARISQLYHNRNLLKEMGIRSRALAEESFDRNKILERYLEMLQSVMGGGC